MKRCFVTLFHFTPKQSDLASQYLQKFCLESRKHTETFFHQNKSTLTQGLGKLKSEVGSYIKDSRPPLDISEPCSSDLGFLSVLMDNPIMEILLKFNPMNWLVEVVKEEFSDIIRFPNVGESFAKISRGIFNLISDEVQNVGRLMEDLGDKLTELINDRSAAPRIAIEFLQNTFWTMWDGISRCLVAIYDMFTHGLEGMFELAMGTWKIPLVATLFEKLAQQDLSLMNVATFVLAASLTIGFQASTGEMPFEVLPDPLTLFTDWTP